MTSEALRAAINELFGNNIDECGEVSPDLDRQILKLIATSLPEKKELTNDCDPTEIYGWNAYHIEAIKLLGGGDNGAGK